MRYKNPSPLQSPSRFSKPRRIKSLIINILDPSVKSRFFTTQGLIGTKTYTDFCPILGNTGLSNP